ncbi:alpha/beta hydrolase [Streptomyces spinosirectus]|uniref:alpha/beta fold hydrolase n=1 Tax=Streptomyces TaxID=1883 RepID=UPI000FFF30B5|nr:MULTISPECIES: alpha/beta hydrolase [Streptomyces]MBY8345272.1 alpha/beta hydrolase [Streptomyces plumbidurans]UIR17728.1 alpha/beta hydrolase [Streptomyces spinosirectus]
MLADNAPPDGEAWQLLTEHTVGGELLRVLERSAASPGAARLVLVHGFDENPGSWTPLARCLPRQLHLYALQLPWCSGSSHRWADEGGSALWLKRALALLPDSPDLIVAHSFGATALLDLLARRTTGAPTPAVLVAPVYRPHDRPLDPEFFAEAVRRFRTVLDEGLRSRMGPRAATVPADIFEAMTGKVRERVEPHGFLQFYATLARAAELPLHRITSPVRLVSGPHDPSAPPDAVAELLRRIPVAEARQDPSFGHFCQVQAPDAVAAHIVEFLGRLGLFEPDTEAVSA